VMETTPTVLRASSMPRLLNCTASHDEEQGCPDRPTPEAEAGTLIHAAIAAKFRTQWPHDPRVKDADLRALATEVRDLMPAAAYWDEQQLPEPLPLTITPFSPKDAEKKYLERFREVS